MFSTNISEIKCLARIHTWGKKTKNKKQEASNNHSHTQLPPGCLYAKGEKCLY